jgi:glycosyltransferase involved in cell wall biosynthesis
MGVSVIVSNMNGIAYLPRLLETLKNQRMIEVQIIVVDRFSVDGSFEYLASDKEIVVMREPPETGLVSGYAAGVPHAVYDHLFFCNEDMWFDSDCLRLLGEKIDLFNGVVAADPWQWTYDGKNMLVPGLPLQIGIFFARTRFEVTSFLKKLIPATWCLSHAPAHS